MLIDITKDAQFQEFDFAYRKCTSIRSYVPVPDLNLAAITQAAALINSAKKPFIVWGQGIILGEAEQELIALIEKAGIPDAWIIMGASAVPTTHTLNKGMLGMHGNYAPNVLTNECDVLIAIGVRFDDRVTGDLSRYAKQAKVIHFEIDPAEVHKNVHAHVVVLGNAKESLTQLLPLIEKNSHPSWLTRFDELDTVEQEKGMRHDLKPLSENISMAEAIAAINRHTAGNAAVVTDVGQHQVVACRYAQFMQTRSNITSGGLGTMGFALPAAIGAKLAAPERDVVAVIGDGDYQMTIQELGTIFQTQVPVKIVVLNNEV